MKGLFVFVAALVACVAGGVSLDGEWRLDYFPQPDEGPVRTLPLQVETKQVRATVPGNCELDLVHAGLLPAPEVGLNVLKLRPYEAYQWLYTRTFAGPSVKKGQRVVLTFDGIDTLADVFLNGQKIGSTENMLIPHSFDVTRVVRPRVENTVQVLIRSVLLDSQYKTLGQLGYSMSGGAEGEPYRKAGHMGGWDIFPRVFVAGLWRSVRLEVQEAERIDQPSWIIRDLNRKDRWANLLVRCRIQAPFRWMDKAKVRYSLIRNGKTAAQTETLFRHYQPSVGMMLHNADLWWPLGFGDPALYDAQIELIAPDGRLLARNVEKIGIRTIDLEYQDIYGKDRPGQFLFRINGEPIYIRGTNWVPLDSFHARDPKHLLSTLALVKDLNCNMIRVWGGGVYESDAFFDYCDANGIMVWQDFMTGCSVFPMNDEYARMTREEVLQVVLRLRNRASLALWAGNNENDGAFHWQLGHKLKRDPNQDRNSRKTIPEVLYEFDVTRKYLPSSPYESPEYVAGRAKMPEDHLWGARQSYKVPFYTNSPCWFASEMGYHGCPRRESLEKMMTPGHVYPWKNAESFEWNDEWQLKACNPFLKKESGLWRRNNLMINQVRILFGEVSRDLDTFIAQSETVQAEAMKTFVELFRSRKFKRCNGLIWWNVRDGWPIISDAVVDYYGCKKPAYDAIKRVQHNQLVMLGDDHRAVAVNDRLYPVNGRVTFTDKESGKILLARDYEVPANGVTELGKIPFHGQGLIVIEYTADGETLRNHFLYGEPPFKWDRVKTWLAL